MSFTITINMPIDITHSRCMEIVTLHSHHCRLLWCECDSTRLQTPPTRLWRLLVRTTMMMILSLNEACVSAPFRRHFRRNGNQTETQNHFEIHLFGCNFVLWCNWEPYNSNQSVMHLALDAIVLAVHFPVAIQICIDRPNRTDRQTDSQPASHNCSFVANDVGIRFSYFIKLWALCKTICLRGSIEHHPPFLAFECHDVQCHSRQHTTQQLILCFLSMCWSLRSKRIHL